MNLNSHHPCGGRKGLSLEPVLHKQKLNICYNYEKHTEEPCVSLTQFVAPTGHPLCLQGVGTLPADNYNSRC